MFRVVGLIALTMVMLSLIGCQSDHSVELSQRSSTTLFANTMMTMDYRIIVGKPLSPSKKRVVEEIIAATFAETNAIYNKWNPHSELSRLNRLKANEKVSLSPSLYRLFLLTDEIFEISEGRFDPTIEPLQQLWKSKLVLGTTPNQKEIQQVIPSIGWKGLHFEKGVFYKDNDLTQLDFGGIAKGLCIDQIVERLNEAGYLDLFVEWGGEIRASGEHPDHRPWSIFISHLGESDPATAIAHVSLANQAIATSGDYLQNWTVQVVGEGILTAPKVWTYFHIFDPHTYQPLIISSETVASASVLAATCAFADGLATAAMLFPSHEDAQQWAKRVKKRFPSVQFWLIGRCGSKGCFCC